MNRGLWVCAVSIWAACAAWSVSANAPEAEQSTPPAAAAVAPTQDTITRYCVGCHNDRLKTSGLSLEKADIVHAAAHPEIWENVVRKLQARAMPPQGARRPDEAAYRALESAIEQTLDAH